MEEEEELLHLRIQALKSSTRTSVALEIDNESSLLQNLSSSNSNKDSVYPNVNLTEEKPVDKYSSQLTETKNANDQNCELKLRQKALMSLLQNRVVKTSQLIKKKADVVQTYKTKKPTRLKIKVTGIQRKKKTDSLNPKKLDKLSKPLKKSEKELDEPFEEQNAINCDSSYTFVKKISVGSEDEISLCASDNDESESSSENHKILTTSTKEQVSVSETVTDVQCNIVSCSQEVEKINLELNPQQVCLESRNDLVAQTSETITNTPQSSLVETIAGLGFNICDTTTSKDIDKLNDSIDVFEKTKSEHVNAECEPGPSGYQPVGIRDSDSDDSIILLPTPAHPVPAFIEISDSDDETKKRKLKNMKKKTLKDVLDEQLRMSGSRDDLKDKSCSICLGPFENRSFLEECFHSFCYICIIQWSELSRLCPLCKVKYNALVHSVTKDLDYERFIFPKDERVTSKKCQTDTRSTSQPMEDGRRFRYRSTMVNTEAWNIRRAQREAAERERSRTRDQRKMNRRLKWSATKDRRKAVYRMKMKVRTVKQSGRPKFRDISPKFFCDNPAMKHRLVPWLLRDLSVLLGDDDENIRFVMSLVLNLISKTAMEGEEFEKQLKPFLFNETSHFVHELTSFASSPYDIRGYDDNVVYDIPVPSDDNVSVVPDVAIETSTAERILRDVFLGVDEVEQPETLPFRDAEESQRRVNSSSDSGVITPVSGMVELPSDIKEEEEAMVKQPEQMERVTSKETIAATNSNEHHLQHDGEVAMVNRIDAEKEMIDAERNINVDATSGTETDDESKKIPRKHSKKHKHKKGRKRKYEADDEAPKKHKKHKKKHDRHDGEPKQRSENEEKSEISSRKKHHVEKKKKSKKKRNRSPSCDERADKHSRGDNYNQKKKKKKKKKKNKENHKKDIKTELSSKLHGTENHNSVFTEELSLLDDGELRMIKKPMTSCSEKFSKRCDGKFIKDEENLKTRAEVIKELILIEEAITNRRKDKKKLKKSKFQNTRDDREVSGNNSKEGIRKNEKKSCKNGKTYLKLMEELQEIEGKINNCRNSLESYSSL